MSRHKINLKSNFFIAEPKQVGIQAKKNTMMSILHITAITAQLYHF